MSLRPGDTAGPYVVEQVVGIGGMAMVFRVRHQVLGSVHALKVLRADLVADPTTRARFLTEGQLQAGFRHPGLVRVTGTVVEPGIAGLVMDYLHGQNLESFIEHNGRLEAALAIAWLIEALDALGHAHDRGVVHRDLKPANLFLETDPAGGARIRILDFGIAKVQASTRTATGATMGTCSYMSPEQVRRPRDVDHRTDIFALGAVLYEMVTGTVAFDAETTFETMNRIVEGRFTPPSELVDLPPGLEAVIHRALAHDPGARFEHCRSFSDALAVLVVAPVQAPIVARLDTPAPPTRGVAPTVVDHEPAPDELAVGSEVIAQVHHEAISPDIEIGSEVVARVVESFEDPPGSPTAARVFSMSPVAPHEGKRPRRWTTWMLVGLFVAGPLAVALVLLAVGAVVQAGVELAQWLGDDGGPGGAGSYTMVRIEPAEFFMGRADGEDWEARHRVAITAPYLLGATEVSQALYTNVMGDNPVEKRVRDWDGRKTSSRCATWGLGWDMPVMCVDWYDAIAFCNALSRREGLQPAYDVVGDRVAWNRGADGYRLPTEAEWELAARAGTAHTWAGTTSEADVCAFGNVFGWRTQRAHRWIQGQSFACDDGVVALASVGQFRANGWGLYDLTGNVREWVWDGFAPYPTTAATNPIGPNDPEQRVLRGGAWGSPPEESTVSFRSAADPHGRSQFVGFRVARTAR